MLFAVKYLLMRFRIVLQNLSTIPNCLWFPTSTYLILILYCFNKFLNFLFVNSDPESHSRHKKVVIFSIRSIPIPNVTYIWDTPPEVSRSRIHTNLPPASDIPFLQRLALSAVGKWNDSSVFYDRF